MGHVRNHRGLFISDIHMSNKLPHAKPTKDGLTDRLEDQIALWERVAKTAEDSKVHAVYILGDLFDKSLVDPVTLTATARCLSKLPVRSYIIGGNHDASTVRGGRFMVEAFGEMDGNVIYLPTEPKGYKVSDWLHFWPVEYMTVEKTQAVISEMQTAAGTQKGQCHVLMMHNSVLGCEHWGWTCDDGLDPDWVCRQFDAVLSGHFHDPQEFGKCGQYLGAPMHHRFDDEGRNAGYWVVEFEKRSMSWAVKKVFHDGGCPRFHTEKWGDKKARKLESYNKGDYIRVVVEAAHAEYESVKLDVMAYIDKLKEAGFRAHHKHKPVYHHAARLKSRGDTAEMTLDVAVDGYPDLPDVETDGLDIKKLKRIGRAALEGARKEVGWAE